ncbi:MAG: PEP-CTERM sorting domain-containing protein [Pseudomonadota bacterium]
MIKNLLAVMSITALSAVNPASATLVDNGGGLIYDTDLNVTWLNLTGSAPGYPYGMSWDQAINWTSNINAGTVSGWRLPLGVYSSHGATNEIQHLVITELGNSVYGSLLNKGPLSALIQGGRYWLGAEVSWDKAWTFDLASNLEKGDMYKSWEAYALAVHDGNIGPTGVISSVPEPSSFLLFASGLLTFTLAIPRRSVSRTALPT